MSWNELYACGAKCAIRFTYTGFGSKGPAPSADADSLTHLRYAISLAPPVPAEVVVTAECLLLLSDDEIFVRVDRPLMLSYGCGPTLPRSEFILNKDGVVMFTDEEFSVYEWDHHEPTWQFVV